jgi:RPA family protein
MRIIYTLFICLFFQAVFSQDTIPATLAKDHLNELICVTGKVISYKLSKEEKKTNYINLDSSYPNQIFTIIVTNDYLENNKINLEDLKNKIIYVYGKITIYKNDPKQIPQIFNPRWIDIKK